MTKTKNVRVIGPDHSVSNIFYRSPDFNIDNTSDPDIVVFTGGADINPLIYNQKPIPQCGSILYDRDKREIEAFHKYRDIPKASICRGGQLLNVLSGGNMFQHVNNHMGNHPVVDLTGIFPRGLVTNSCHHQMMVPGPDGELLAYTEKRSDVYLADPNAKLVVPDVDPEVIYYSSTKSLCYQAHPEWVGPETDNHRYFLELIKYLF
jgi:hypothetical protein